MKYSVIVTLALILTAPHVVQAAPSQGQMLTMCKQEVAQTFGDVGRIKVKKMRRNRIEVSARIPNVDDLQTIICEFEKGSVRLANRDGTELKMLSATD
jgi:hypothetical protein